MKVLLRVAAAAAVLAFGSLGNAVAQPSVSPGAGENPTNPKFLSLSVDSVSPSTVTVLSDPQLTVVATITNVGDRPVDDISVRLQRTEPVTDATQLRSTLRLTEAKFSVAGKFDTIAARLAPGERKQFTYRMPLRAATDAKGKVRPSLRITEPGVYPMLLNVNGKPAYGKQARLDDAHFLLPVLGVPAEHAAQAVAAPATTPVATTVLWPLADRPRRLAGQPGSMSDQVTLIDDDLATSLAPNGRLDQLVAAVETATNNTADPNGRLRKSICLAVDPDLLSTVTAMTKGYRVLTNPAHLNGGTKEGRGDATATAWLTRVRALAKDRCVLALPYAQADLTAVAAVGSTALASDAINAPADLVDTMLQVTSQRKVTWPEAGSVDDRAAALLRASGVSTLIIANNAVGSADTPDPNTPDLVRLGTTSLRAATYNVNTASALAAVGDRPTTLSVTPSRLRYDVRQDSRTARMQDALGALTWNAITPSGPRTQLLAPPQLWSPDGAEARAVLTHLNSLLQMGLITGRSLPDLLSQTPAPASYQTRYLSGALADATAPSLREPIALTANRIDQLDQALVYDPNKELTPQRYITPLREDLLRAVSTASRANPAAAHAIVDRVDATISRLFNDVSVLAPSGVYTLASEESPLLLVARNTLPVGIRVLIKIDAPNDVKITDIGVQQLPPNGSRPFQLPTQVSATRNLAVHFALTTPDGHVLGAPTSVKVRSNAYGQPLAIITGCAGTLLTLLAGRRLWHRFRGDVHPADAGLDVSTRRRLTRYVKAKRRQ